jgi:hypothetical protein
MSTKGAALLIALLLLTPVVLGGVIMTNLYASQKLWFLDAGMAVAVGLVSTVAVASLYSLFALSPRFVANAKRLKMITDPFIWGLVSVVFFLIAFGFLNRALYADGVFWLHTHKVWDTLSLADFISLGLFVVLLIVLLLYPFIFSVSRDPDEARDLLFRVRALSIAFALMVLAGSVGAWYVLYRLNPPTLLGAQGARQQAQLLAPGLQTTWWLSLALLGVVIATGLYLTLRQILELAEGVVRLVPGTLEVVRMLLLVVVVLPPLVGAMAFSASVVDGRLPVSVVAIFGLFLYGGVMVWTLAIKLIEVASWARSVLITTLSFAYAWVMTVLWATLIELVGVLWVQQERRAVFDGLLNVSIAMLLIIVVYSSLYRRTWGRGLSDQWPGERANYMIFAMVFGLLIVSMPNDQNLKPIFVSIAILVLLFVPALLMRRRLAAWVLVQIKLGETHAVQEALEAEEIDVASVYGRDDLIAKIEVERRRGSEDALAALSKKVLKIRRTPGVASTETLIDLSHLTGYWIGPRRRR